MSAPHAEPVYPGPATQAVAGAASHAALHQGLDQYLEAVVAVREEPRSVLLLAALLRRNLVAHMRTEEDHVLPWWQKHAVEPPVNATVECFQEDHRLLRQGLLSVLEEAVRGACRPLDPQSLREKLAGLDDLLEHHDQREAELLYPFLEVARDPAAAAVQQAVMETRQVPMDRAQVLLEGWSTGKSCDRILATYHAWVHGRAMPPDVTWEFLDETARAKAALLVQRDQALVERFRGRTFADDRSRLGDERLVEQTLRRTVLVLVDAFLDPCFP